MSREEFIQTVVHSGLASKPIVERYSIGKIDFSPKDMEDVFRINEATMNKEYKTFNRRKCYCSHDCTTCNARGTCM